MDTNETRDGRIEITNDGQFLLCHPVSENELYDSFEELVEDHPVCEKYRNELLGIDKPTACVHVNILNGYGFLRAKLIYPDGRVTQIGSAAGPNAYSEMAQLVREWATEHGYTAQVFAGSGILTRS